MSCLINTCNSLLIFSLREDGPPAPILHGTTQTEGPPAPILHGTHPEQVKRGAPQLRLSLTLSN